SASLLLRDWRINLDIKFTAARRAKAPSYSAHRVSTGANILWNIAPEQFHFIKSDLATGLVQLSYWRDRTGGVRERACTCFSVRTRNCSVKERRKRYNRQGIL